MPIKTISAAQFATAFDLRPNLVAWFLGAGASAASGIPTGYAMIRDFKAQIFCRETNLSKREIDTADPIWIDRIDAFFRQNSLLPPDGDPTEYAKAFEAVYPEARHRRQYIDDAISKGTPCFGHKVLGSLMAAGKVDSVFTTNFDPLIEESAHSANAILPIDGQNRPTVAAIDSADRAMRCLNESDWPLVAKLHGDYQSIAIKNTGSELEEQDSRMRHMLVESGKRFGMIFVGYSGRDASIMEALNTVLDGPSPFPNGLYWLTSSVSRLLPAVIEFLERAGAAGVDVAVVECATFDELAADIIKVTDLPKPLLDRVMEGRPTPRLVPVQIPNAKARAFPVLRYSAILLQSMPTAARRIRLSQSTTSAEVREIFKAKGCRATAAALRRELAVFGRDQEILDALAPLGPSLAGTIDVDPVADSWAMGLLYDTLVRSLARQRPLIPRYSVRAIRSSLQHRATAMILIERGVSSKPYLGCAMPTAPVCLAQCPSSAYRFRRVSSSSWNRSMESGGAASSLTRSSSCLGKRVPKRTVRRVWSPKKLRLKWACKPSGEVILPVTGAANDGLRAIIGIGPALLGPGPSF